MTPRFLRPDISREASLCPCVCLRAACELFGPRSIKQTESQPHPLQDNGELSAIVHALFRGACLKGWSRSAIEVLGYARGARISTPAESAAPLSNSVRRVQARQCAVCLSKGLSYQEGAIPVLRIEYVLTASKLVGCGLSLLLSVAPLPALRQRDRGHDLGQRAFVSQRLNK